MSVQEETFDAIEFYYNPPKKLSESQEDYLAKNDKPSLDFIESLYDLSCTDKAKKFLKEQLQVIRRYIEDTHPSLSTSNLEAITYLKSRGMECGREIELAIQYLDGEQQDEFYYRGIGFQNGKNLSIKEAKKLEPLSTPLECFWRESYNVDIYNDDAYFLRFIDWCKIDDFKEIWLNRLIKEYSQLSNNQDISEDIKMLLFNHCRSDYSILLFKDSLLKLLHYYESIYFEQNGDIITCENDFINYQAIAIIVFANIRLKTANLRVIKEGLRILTDNQIKNGGWSVNNKKKNSDLLTSATVIHSLAIAQEPYWQISAKSGIDFIKSEQNVFGGWVSKVLENIPLIVMILDALEIAKGSTKVTFKVEKPIISNKTNVHSDKEEGRDLQIQKNIHRVTHNQLMKEIYKNKFKLGHIKNEEIIEKADKSRKKNGKLNFSELARKFNNVDSETIKSEIMRRNLSYLIDDPKKYVDKKIKYEKCDVCGKSKIIDMNCEHCIPN